MFRGELGRQYYLSILVACKVVAFCDVDENKIGQVYVDLDTKRPVPIIHFSKAQSPVAIW
jgi:hypothetical protein